MRDNFTLRKVPVPPTGGTPGGMADRKPLAQGLKKIRNLAADPVPNTERTGMGQKLANSDSRILYISGGPGAERRPLAGGVYTNRRHYFRRLVQKNFGTNRLMPLL